MYFYIIHTELWKCTFNVVIHDEHVIMIQVVLTIHGS